MNFDELLTELNVPKEDLDLPFKDVVEKHKPLKEGWLRQSDYSRVMNANKNKIELADRWVDWKGRNWDEDSGMTKAEKATRDLLEQTTAELEATKGQVGVDMTFDDLKDDLDKWVKAQGYVKKDELSTSFVPKGEVFDKDGKALFSSKEDVNRGFAGVEYLYSKVTPLMFKHKDEFNEILDPMDVIKYTNENGFREVDKAYDAMMSTKRAEIAAKKSNEALEAAKLEGKKEGLKEARMGSEGRMPVDNGAPEMGHLQKRLTYVPKEGETPEIPDSAELGKGQLGRLAAEMFRKEQAGKAA